MTGRAFRSIRIALGLTLPQFADRIGIPVDELDAFEKGEKAIDSDRLSTACERLTPDVEKLPIDDPLLYVPSLLMPHDQPQ